MLTNLSLVEHAKKALREKWGYVWGTFGQLLTPSLLTQKINQYPEGVGNWQTYIKKNWMGRKVTDCVGLIKGCYWSESGSLVYNGSTDVNADMMYNKARRKGPMNTLPEIPGVCLWKKGHIGVYIGNGLVIEARGTKEGVIQSKLGDVPWVGWLECPFIEYVAAPVNPSPVTNKIYGIVTADVLNVRYGPSIGHGIAGKLYEGARVVLIEKSNGWYKIDFNGVFAYVSGDFIRVSGTVTADVLNIRMGPSTSFIKLGKLMQNEKVNIDIQGTTSGWYKLLDREGYVSKEYIRLD